MNIKNLFSTKKVNELESLGNELNICNSGISEEQSKQQRLNEGLRLIQIELEVDSSDKELTKRSKRLEVALEESKKRMNDLVVRKGEIDGQTNKLNSEKRKAELEQIAETDLKSYDKARRSSLLKNELDRLKYQIEKGSDFVGATRPAGLMSELGEKIGYFNKSNPAHDSLRGLWEEKTTKADEQMSKELEELKQAILKFVNAGE